MEHGVVKTAPALLDIEKEARTSRGLSYWCRKVRSSDTSGED
jgi:hypothetical protein